MRGGRHQVAGLLLIAACLSANAGCTTRWMDPPSPLKAGYNPVELLDVAGQRDAENQLDMKDLYTIAERVRRERQPACPVPAKNVLVLSGGGIYGAYCAGVLVGWTETGRRPEFDVVTGISTGAVIAPLAFIGPDYDCVLRELYTTLRNGDVFRNKKTLRSLLSESLADNSRFAEKLDAIITPDFLRRIAAEHARGRRLYIGTTDLDSHRPVIWDMGEIATRGTLEDLDLFRKIMLASTSIPGLFPPVKITVNVGGQLLTERHIDGGVTNSMFFRAPYVPPRMMKDPNATCLHGSNVYILVAGKLYADAESVRPRAITIASSSVSTLIYAQTRGDLLKLYMACSLTGMNYHLAAIPPEFPVPSSSTDFDPVAMTKMFDEGGRQITAGTVWRHTPPGLEKREGAFYRVGTELTKVELDEALPPMPSPEYPWYRPFGLIMKRPRDTYLREQSK